DVTDLRNAAANLKGARARKMVSDLISAGKSRAVIHRFLEGELGLTQEQAEQQLTSSRADYDAVAELRGPTDLFVGLVFFLGGAALTAVTVWSALLQGGYALIAYGPVISGGHHLWIA